MPKRSSKPKRPADPNLLARSVVEEAIGEPLRSTEDSSTAKEILDDPALLSRIMAELGRKGGKIGGKRRLTSLTPERRSEIALAAARARWKTAKKKKV